MHLYSSLKRGWVGDCREEGGIGIPYMESDSQLKVQCKVCKGAGALTPIPIEGGWGLSAAHIPAPPSVLNATTIGNCKWQLEGGGRGTIYTHCPCQSTNPLSGP